MINEWLSATFWILVIIAIIGSHYAAYLMGQISILDRSKPQQEGS